MLGYGTLRRSEREGMNSDTFRVATFGRGVYCHTGEPGALSGRDPWYHSSTHWFPTVTSSTQIIPRASIFT